MRARPLALALTLVPLLLVTTLGAATRSAWTAASLASPGATAGTATLGVSHSWTAGSCGGTGPSDLACAGSPLPTGASSSTTQTATDTLTNTTGGAGVASASFTHQVQVESCAPARFANATSAADPMLPRYRVTRQVGDPWGGTGAASFNGVDQYATNAVSTTTAAVAGTSYTLGLWFRAAAGSGGGGLLSLNASPVAATSLGANPTLYLDPAGRVRARLDGVPLLVIPVILSLASPSGTDYRNGAWHHVALTVERKTLTTDIRLYVDGAQVDTQLGAVLLVGTSSDAWWHLAWTDTTGLDLIGNPTPYFGGRLAGVFRATTVLSAAAVAALAASASSSVYAGLLAGAPQLWMLGDAATSTHTAALAYLPGNGLACAQVRASWTLGGTVAFALTPLDQLAGAVLAPASPAAAPAAGSSQALVLGYARIASGYDTDVSGLELVVVLVHRLALSGSAWTLRSRWSGAGVLA